MQDPTPKSCITCPSYLPDNKTVGQFGASIGAAMCLRFGKVLDSGDMKEGGKKLVAERVAANCADHGKPAPKAPPGYWQTMALTPYPDVLTEIAQDPPTEDEVALVTSCIGCRFYIEPKIVGERFGWGSGACGFDGRIIFPGRQSKEAKSCTVSRARTSRTFTPVWEVLQFDPDKLDVMPDLKAGFEYDPSPLGQWKKAKKNGTLDPAHYQTDAPVEAGDLAAGIRAWRRVTDPESGNSTMLPIFDPGFFDPVDRAAIPQTGDATHPEDYIDAANYLYSVAVELMEMDLTPALWGQAGVGKTELARHLAWLMQLPFDRMSFTAETEVEDVIGKVAYDPEKGTYYKMGRLPLAWQRPRVLLLDEPNTAPNALWQRIRPLTDNNKQFVLDESYDAEPIDRYPFCFMLMAMNPPWDSGNIGAETLGHADMDRLTHIFMDLPPRDVEREILRTACQRDGWEPSVAMLEGVLDNSEEIRRLVEDGSLPVNWGVRPNLKVIRHLKWYDPATAYKRAILDAIEPEAAKMVLKTIGSAGRL